MVRVPYQSQSLGIFLASLRNPTRLSQEEVASLVGSTRSGLSRLETGESVLPLKGPTRTLLINLAEILCTSRAEVERCLALAQIEVTLLTEDEQLQLGLFSFPPVATGLCQEDLTRMAQFLANHVRELTTRGLPFSWPRTLPTLQAKVQAHKNLLQEIFSRLRSEFEMTPEGLAFLEEPIFSSDDLSEKAPSASPLLDTASYEALATYLQQQRSRLTDAIIPGSYSLRMAEIFDDTRLFIPLPWDRTTGHSASGNLVETLLAILLRRQRLLLLGDAGQGKTTVLKRVFVCLVDQFLVTSSPHQPLPLYFPLREFPTFTGNPLDLLWTQLGEEFPISSEQFTTLVRNKQVVFLFDGFDEIQGELSQRAINERAASKLFTYPSILSCRTHFFMSYLAMSPLRESYPQQIALQPLALTGPVLDYIAAFCQQKHEQPLPDPQEIVTTIQMNPVLMDLAQRPLLLVMILEMFTDSQAMRQVHWSITMLYQRYTQRWLKHEAAKPDSVLKWNEKAFLLQELAWRSYTERSGAAITPASQQVVISYEELGGFVQGMTHRFAGITDLQVLDDLCFRTLLLGMAEGDTYTFLHKSFQEYYVARYVFACMRSQDLETIERVLQTSLPFDVALFLKDILYECRPHEKGLIATNLITVYQRNGADDSQAITIRQQASHYLTNLNTETAIHFLEQIWEKEPNKWVQRGIMVGLGLYSGRVAMLERYLRIIHEDPEAAAINISYHVIYYDNQRQPVDALPQGEECDQTIKALFRHLQNERYRNGWPLDLLTLSTLVEQRGLAILRREQVAFLRAFLRTHSKLSDSFQREREHLQYLLEGANDWT